MSTTATALAGTERWLSDGFLDANVEARKLREIETPDERTKIIEAYRAQRRELRHGRLDIPRCVPPMSGHDLWDSNRPGSTLFLPVCDVSASLISLIAHFVDPALRATRLRTAA